MYKELNSVHVPSGFLKMISSIQREETTRVLIRNNLLIKIFNNNFVRYCGSESTYYTFVRGKTGL